MTVTEQKYMASALSRAKKNDDEASVATPEYVIRGTVTSEQVDNGTEYIIDSVNGETTVSIIVTHDGDGDWVSNPEGMSVETSIDYGSGKRETELQAVNVWDIDLPDMNIYDAADEMGVEVDDIREGLVADEAVIEDALHELQTLRQMHEDLIGGNITLLEAVEKTERMTLRNGGSLALDNL